MEEGGGWLYLMGLKRVTIFCSENFLMMKKVDWWSGGLFHVQL